MDGECLIPITQEICHPSEGRFASAGFRPKRGYRDGMSKAKGLTRFARRFPSAGLKTGSLPTVAQNEITFLSL